jgi:hypothetical protein
MPKLHTHTHTHKSQEITATTTFAVTGREVTNEYGTTAIIGKLNLKPLPSLQLNKTGNVTMRGVPAATFATERQ